MKMQEENANFAKTIQKKREIRQRIAYKNPNLPKDCKYMQIQSKDPEKITNFIYRSRKTPQKIANPSGKTQIWSKNSGKNNKFVEKSQNKNEYRQNIA